jgi:hypothetical protein
LKEKTRHKKSDMTLLNDSLTGRKKIGERQCAARSQPFLGNSIDIFAVALENAEMF